MLVVKTDRDKVYWPSTEGVRGIYFTIDAWRWLNLVTQMIHLLGNTFDIIYPWDLVVECAI